MLDVFRPHAPDQTNRGPVFAYVGEDPESHGRRAAKRGTAVQWTDRSSIHWNQ
jgi:hypothetical protein